MQPIEKQGGRTTRKYASNAERQRAYRVRKSAGAINCNTNSACRDNGTSVTDDRYGMAQGIGAPEFSAPSWLSAYAREEWRKVAPLLAERGRLAPEIEGLVAAYCAAVATIREAETAMAREGHMVKSANGVTRAHPLLGPKNRATSTALQLAKRLGLLGDTPAGKGGEDGDPYADLGIH